MKSLQLIIITGLFVLTGAMALAWLDTPLGDVLTHVHPALKVPLSLVDLLVWTLAALYLVERFHSGRLRQMHLPPLPVLLLLGWMVLSAFVHPPQSLGDFKANQFQELFQHAEYLIAGYLLYANLIETPRRLRMLVLVLGTFVLAAVMIAGYQRLAGYDAFIVDGGFADRNLFGAFMAIVAPLGVGMALRSRDVLVQVLASVPAVAGLVLVTSGGAWLALVVGILLSAAVLGRKYLTVTAFVVLGVIALSFVLFAGTRKQPGHADRLLQSVQPFVKNPQTGDRVIAQRYRRWQANAELIKRQPWTGVGPGYYKESIDLYYPSGLEIDAGGVPTNDRSSFNVTADEPNTHSWFFVMAAENGLPALFFLVWTLIWFVGRAARAVPGPDDDPGDAAHLDLAAGLVGSLAAMLIMGLWTNLLVRGLAMTCVFLLAAADTMARRRDGVVEYDISVEAAPLSPNSSSGWIRKPIYGFGFKAREDAASEEKAEPDVAETDAASEAAPPADKS